jgi:hypothetical protein
MSAVTNTPENKNFLSPINFRFQIKRSPHLNFFIQRVNLPAIRLPDVTYPNPVQNIPYFGEHMEYADLVIEFKVDEDLQNYLELHNWLIQLGTPERLDQYREISQKETYTGEGVFSDITLIVLSSAMNANYEIVFRDCYPMALSELEFDTSSEDVNYLTCMATFKYTLYNINQL